MMTRETTKLAENVSKGEKLMRGKSPAFAMGAALIALGCLLFVGQLFGWSVGSLLWPLWIMVPGAAVLLFGLAALGDSGEAMCIVGSIISAVGLLLFVQNVTGLWQSWAYAWALIGPTSVGVGIWLHGVFKERPDKIQSGRELIKVGLTMFVVAAVFFELVIGISGFGLGQLGLPVVLIGLGLFFLARNLVGRTARER